MHVFCSGGVQWRYGDDDDDDDDWQQLWRVDLGPDLFCGQFMFQMLQVTAEVSRERPRRALTLQTVHD